MAAIAMDWTDEMERVLALYNRETKLALGNIKMVFKRNGLSFNRKFREYFLKESTNRISSAFDQFEIESMLEKEVNHTETNVSTAQSVEKLKLDSVIKLQKIANGNHRQMNHPIEIDDSSYEETIHIKSETSEGIANELNGATVNSTAGQSTSSIQINDTDDDEMADISRAHGSHTFTNQSAYKVGKHLNVSNGQGKIGENSRDMCGNNDSISIRAEEGIQPREPKFDDDVPVVLIEINRMANASIANVTSVDSKKESKKNNDTNDDRGHKDGSTSELTKALPRKSSIAPIAKQQITTKSKPIYKSNGDKSAPKQSKPKKRFRCTVCEYSSNWKGNLKIHMRTHTGEKPHRCQRCGRRFTTARNLKVHAVTHTDDFPFYCFGCFRGFRLKVEKEVHDKDCKARRNECHICKKFVAFDKTNLKIHMRSHTGEKPFRCEICLKRFTQKRSLKTHLNNIHTRINP